MFYFLFFIFLSAEPEKPGVCPKNPEVALLGGCVERCSHDRDCPKDEKCCSKGCGQQCMPPYREPEKPGVCPKNPEVALLGGCVERCSHDRDCPKDEKCCSKGCGQQCMPPYRGICNIGVRVSFFFPPLLQRLNHSVIWFPCCACIKEKPGVCPSKNLGIGVCAELCSHDRDCPNDEKCCSNGCGHQYALVKFPPAPIYQIKSVSDLVFLLRVCITGKPGMCPRRFFGEGLCEELCVNDIDCPNNEKCCRTKCGRECTLPFKGISQNTHYNLL
uniref:Perlwapin-like n=1 Tax=Sinocyclocheilus rhinocerous TaxID=307959 RepID=A0A673IW36_9TELE